MTSPLVGQSGAGAARNAWRRSIGVLLSRLWDGQVTRRSLPLVGASLLGIALSFAKSVVLARSLGVAGFGQLSYALAITLFVGQFANMKTGDNLVRFVGAALARGERSRATTYAQLGVVVDVTAAVLALAIVYWIAGPLAAGHSNQTALRQMIEIYALALPFLLLRSTFMGLLTALKSFRAVAGLQVALPAAELAAISWLARQGEAAAVTGLAIGAITASLITIALGGWLFWRSTGSWRGAGYRDAWRELRPFTIYGSLQGSLKSLTANLDLVVLGFFRPASEVGYYALARSGVGVLATMVAPLAQVLHPLLNEAWVGRRWGELRRLIASFMLINGLAGLAALAALLLMGRWLVTNIYGPAYTPAVVLMQVLVIAVALQAVFAWMRRLLLVAGRPRLDLIAGVFGTAFFLILVVPASVFGGAIGLAGLEILRATLMVAIFAWAISTKVGTRSLDLESS